MKTMPIARAYWPRNGTLPIADFITKRSGTGTARNSAQMSIIDWWLATIMRGFDQSTPSAPSTE